MRRSFLQFPWTRWCGILGVAGCLSLSAGDKVTVSGPKKQADNSLDEKSGKDEASKPRDSLFDLLRAKPSILNPFGNKDSLGGDIGAPLIEPSQPMDSASQKRLLDKLNERKNWLQEGMKSGDSGISTSEGVVANTNSAEMFLTPSQRARINFGYRSETGDGNSKKLDNNRRVSPLEVQGESLNNEAFLPGEGRDSQELGDKRDGATSREELGVFGFIQDSATDKSMFDFNRSGGSGRDGQNGFLPGLVSSGDGPTTTLFGNRLLAEPKAPFGSATTASSSPSPFGADAFGSSAFDTASKPGFNFGNEPSQTLGPSVTPRSAFSAPDPVFTKPAPAPTFVPRPINLPLPDRGL